MTTTNKHLILGTAGHVDHGKTTLIKAMTDINTDRLKEEQERGLTIDIGFAHLRLPSGRIIGIVDVPGHEKFLKNMLAGASGVDIALLVVAADEGVMPQTKEHLEILDLLETHQGVIALTKCDLVDDEWLDVVEEDVRTTTKDTFLKNARIVRVSGTTGKGVADLIAEIDRLADTTQQRSSEGPFRLPIDRVFTMTGFGTIVTGTLVSGTLRVGDVVTVLPQGLQSRVRGLQVHGKKQELVEAGSRTAVNLVGVEVAELERGNVLVPPGYLQASTILDASVTVLPDSPKPLSNRTRVRLHIGTTESIGRAMILGSEEIVQGSKGIVQLRLEEPVVAARGDRFVIRFYSPTRVLGGGIVLDPIACRHRRNDQSVIERLQRTLQGNSDDIIFDVIAISETGLIKSEIVRKSGLSEQEITTVLKRLAEEGRVLEYEGRWLTRTSYEGIATRIRTALNIYHNANPMRSGMPKEELKAQFGPRMDPKGVQAIVALMAASDEIIVSERTVRLSSHVPTLNEQKQRLLSLILAEILNTGISPPSVGELVQKYGPETREMLSFLVERGELVKITPDLLFHSRVIRQTEEALKRYLQTNGQMTVAQFRDLVSSSRKYVVPLLEYFDAKRVTRRIGDLRILAKSNEQKN